MIRFEYVDYKKNLSGGSLTPIRYKQRKPTDRLHINPIGVNPVNINPIGVNPINTIKTKGINPINPINGEGMRRKRRKKKIKYQNPGDEYEYRGNASLKQMVKNLTLRKEKEIKKEQEDVLRKQNQLYTSLLNL